MMKKVVLLLRLKATYFGGKAVVDVGKICHRFQVRAAQSKHHTACRLRQQSET
jgi:hypothetical protein